MNTQSEFQHESLTSLSEGDLVSRLLEDQQWRSRVIGVHGIPSNAKRYLEVSLSGLPGNPEGDIDILMVPPGFPEQSIAVQVKRVKVSDRAFLVDAPNKLGELKKPWRQAGIVAQLGFSQVYCFVFVVVDSRAHNGGEHSYAGLTPELKRMIDQAISTRDLDERVGLVRFEFVQPMDDRPLGAGTFSGKAVRLAQKLPQTQEVTEWVIARIEQIEKPDGIQSASSSAI